MPSAGGSPIPSQGAAPAPIEQLLETAATAHTELLSRNMSRINALAEQASLASADQEDLLLLRHRARLLEEELARLFDREEHGVFPMCRRIEQATSLRPCHVGMMKARVRFAVMEQENVLVTLDALKSLSVVQLAPRGPCEICRSIAEALEELSGAVLQHHQFEQEYLFKRATDREDMLAAQIVET